MPLAFYVLGINLKFLTGEIYLTKMHWNYLHQWTISETWYKLCRKGLKNNRATKCRKTSHTFSSLDWSSVYFNFQVTTGRWMSNIREEFLQRLSKHQSSSSAKSNKKAECKLKSKQTLLEDTGRRQRWLEIWEQSWKTKNTHNQLSFVITYLPWGVLYTG